jgi:HD-like signal output (HDOD) protein
MPATVAKVLQQLSCPEWTIEEVQATIARDPALVARMISVSNSALFGGGHEFKTLNQALVRLGFRAIRSLAVVAAARALFPLEDEELGARGQQLWDHAAACGASARMVAEGVKQRDPDDAFAAGVLHDIGKVVVLLNRPADLERILAAVRDEGLDSRAAETAVLGVDHTRLAAWVTESWNLPANIVGAVVAHHDPAADEEHERLSRIVHCGNLLAHLHAGDGDRREILKRLHAELARFGLAFDAAEELADQIRVRLVSLTDLF